MCALQKPSAKIAQAGQPTVTHGQNDADVDKKKTQKTKELEIKLKWRRCHFADTNVSIYECECVSVLCKSCSINYDLPEAFDLA